MQAEAEKEVNCETVINFVCWDGLWHSTDGSGMPPHIQQGQQENSEQQELK